MRNLSLAPTLRFKGLSYNQIKWHIDNGNKVLFENHNGLTFQQILDVKPEIS